MKILLQPNDIVLDPMDESSIDGSSPLRTQPKADLVSRGSFFALALT
jgi:hypothetical protein